MAVWRNDSFQQPQCGPGGALRSLSVAQTVGGVTVVSSYSYWWWQDPILPVFFLFPSRSHLTLHLFFIPFLSFLLFAASLQPPLPPYMISPLLLLSSHPSISSSCLFFYLYNITNPAGRRRRKEEMEELNYSSTTTHLFFHIVPLVNLLPLFLFSSLWYRIIIFTSSKSKSISRLSVCHSQCFCPPARVPKVSFISTNETFRCDMAAEENSTL